MNTYGGHRIRYDEVVPFMFSLGPDLGFPEEVPRVKAGGKVLLMGLF